MASENQFTVDLGTMKLTDAQRNSINAAIQKAVAGELASIGGADKIALIPASKWKVGPIINGIIARPIDERIFKELVR
jgi:hypothetical protein